MSYSKIRADSFTTFFSMVEAYAKDEWQLKKYYIENFAKQGVILENAEGNTVEIWSEAIFEGEGKNAAEIVSSNIKRIAQLFSSQDNKEEQQKRKDEKKIEEEKSLVNFTFQSLNNFEELKEKVRKFYQKYQAKIKQNPDFTEWIEISEKTPWNSDEENSKFYIYLGKKRNKKLKGDKKNIQSSLIMERIFGEKAIYWKINFVYSIEKENNENLPKELERFWSDLVKINEEHNIKPALQTRERERERERE
jgi:hypothetical protein